MDPFFDNFFNHAGFGPPMAQREVPEARLQHYRGRLPEQLLAYWQRDGWCGWGQGLLWTVDPEAWRENLATWLARRLQGRTITTSSRARPLAS